MGAHDRAVDHLDTVLPAAAVVQRLQNDVPDPGQCPAPELADWNSSEQVILRCLIIFSERQKTFAVSARNSDLNMVRMRPPLHNRPGGNLALD